MSLNGALAFRRLMQVALASGAAAGVVLFLIQTSFVTPLIREAERYGRPAATMAAHHAHDASTPGAGIGRRAYAGLGAVLLGIGFAAVLFGVASLAGLALDARRGILLGTAGFVCFVLAPSIGVLPRPPGVHGPELGAAQSWWVLTVVLSGIGLWLLTNPRHSNRLRAVGVLSLALPHLIGAPAAPPSNTVPPALAWRFAATAIGTQAIFWLLLGALGGWAFNRSALVSVPRPGGVDERL